MGSVLGVCAGSGMLLFVALLLFVFCMDMHWLSKEKLIWLLKGLGTVLSVAAAYRLTGALLYFFMHEPNGSLADYQLIFQNDRLRETYMALEIPALRHGLNGVFASIAHGLGQVLFRQYAFAAEVLSFLCTGSAMLLLLARLQWLFGKKSGEEIAFLVLCLPCSVYFFLPGSAPLLLLIGAMLFFFLGKLLPKKEFSIPPCFYSLFLIISMLGSAAVVYTLTTGA